MREFLTSGQVGQIELNEQKRIRKEINERWDALGMTEGLKGVVKENIATLYENEAKALLSEATASDNSGSFETVVFPIIRRVFSKLLANDIVSVQAMNLPIGKLFFMLPVTSEREWKHADGSDFKTGEDMSDVYGRHKGLMGYERTDRRNGNKYNRYYLPDESVNGMAFEYTTDGGENWEKLTATTYDAAVAEAAEKGDNALVRQASPAITSYHKRTLYDLFYNDFLYDNSKGKIHIKLGTATPVVFDNYDLVDVDAEHPIKVYADGSVRSCILKVTGFSSFNAGKLTGPDGNEMDTEAFLASLKVYAKDAINGDGFACFDKNEGIPFRIVTQKYGKGMVEYADACDAEGCIYLDVDLAKPCKKQGETLDGYKGIDTAVTINATTFGVAWSQYDSLELETEIGEVSFKLDSVTVSVEERKLRATWSPELAQDVSAFHNIDAEAELTALLSEQIAAEIYREILRDLRKSGSLGCQRMAQTGRFLYQLHSEGLESGTYD